MFIRQHLWCLTPFLAIFVFKDVKLNSLTESRSPRIIIVGAGNIAWHLGHALKAGDYDITGIIGRNHVTGEELAAELDTVWNSSLAIPRGSCDLLFLAVNDSALKDVAEQLEVSDAIVVHTAGSISIETLKRFDRYGVFYPFQTLTKGIPCDFSKVPLCIEASDADTEAAILQLAESISNTVSLLGSQQRKKLHLAGIILNNFTNHLITRATDFAERNELDPELLYPLLQETLDKLRKTSSDRAQTGPAKRKDFSVINEHLEMLSDEPELKNLYRLITDSIIAYYSTD